IPEHPILLGWRMKESSTAESPPADFTFTRGFVCAVAPGDLARPRRASQLRDSAGSFRTSLLPTAPLTGSGRTPR
ncbi:MAG: hypothetical protein WD990_03795, partial [Acidimicrobiia bacterium]